MILAVTGHRPAKVGGYGYEARARLVDFAIVELERLRPVCVLSGMALGWDQAVAMACNALRLPWVAYLPCPEQPSKWPPESRSTYFHLLEQATDVVMVSGIYYPACMHHRNEAMMRGCTDVLALWDGSHGGTADCLERAERFNRPTLNAWPRWQVYQWGP